MDMKLEVIVIPVADVDRSVTFYTERCGFHLDVDHRGGDGFRVVQVTPPGSACSVIFGVGVSQVPPGSAQGLHLVVTDLVAAQAEFAGRGVDVTPVRHLVPGTGWVDGLHPDNADYGSFAFFSDPDGNGWALQQWRGQSDSSTS